MQIAKMTVTWIARCISNLPPLVGVIILVVTYYIYVVYLCVYLIDDPLKSSLYIFFYNIIFVMFIWSFLATVFTRNAKVPKEYQLTDEEVEHYYQRDDKQYKDLLLQSIQSKRNLVLYTRTKEGYIRYCHICKQIKPDRAHHCSTCEVCILRMDHHCGWVNNCVGFSNNKYFILALFYGIIYCIYFMSTSEEYFILDFGTQKEDYLPIVIGFLMAAFIGILIGIFFIYSCSLLFGNQTTIEKIQVIRFIYSDMSYDLGCGRNFLEMFGKNWVLWFFPIFSGLGNGCTFPIKQQSQV